MECVICGGRNFGPGPSGRMAATGLLPQCIACQSLERHRAIRKFFNDIYDPTLFSSLDVLQFSKDPAVEENWFNKYEYSIYDGYNSLDLQRIDRPDHTYHLVICNHVLEHVADDGAALRELMRVARRDGMVFLTVPAPLRRRTTVDWGHADMSRHGHYREYGADISQLFDVHIPEATVLRVKLEDTVTGANDVGFVLAHGQNNLVSHISNTCTAMAL
jgi:hypothetical protein